MNMVAFNGNGTILPATGESTMTCEIALLNRRAVALAADSATTVFYWEQGERKDRYFKGTNKLFHLSTVHPVALMTSDSGNLHGVPWEVVVKAYRDFAPAKYHDYIPGYAIDLFEYIQTNVHLFPPEFQERQLISDIENAASRIIFAISLVPEVSKARTAGDHKAAEVAAKNAFASLSKAIEAAPLIASSKKEMADEIRQKYHDKILNQIQNRKYVVDRSASISFEELAKMISFEELAKLAPTATLTKIFTTLDTTDIVVAGFGDKEYFPHLKSYTTYGLVLGKLQFEEGEEKIINQENTAEIVPIAQANMIKTFIYGVPPATMGELRDLRRR